MSLSIFKNLVVSVICGLIKYEIEIRAIRNGTKIRLDDRLKFSVPINRVFSFTGVVFIHVVQDLFCSFRIVARDYCVRLLFRQILTPDQRNQLSRIERIIVCSGSSAGSSSGSACTRSFTFCRFLCDVSQTPALFSQLRQDSIIDLSVDESKLVCDGVICVRICHVVVDQLFLLKLPLLDQAILDRPLPLVFLFVLRIKFIRALFDIELGHFARRQIVRPDDVGDLVAADLLLVGVNAAAVPAHIISILVHIITRSGAVAVIPAGTVGNCNMLEIVRIRNIVSWRSIHKNISGLCFLSVIAQNRSAGVFVKCRTI